MQTDEHRDTPDRRQPRGPLESVRVLDLGSLLAGPFAGRLLGDFGAEIIKIEMPGIVPKLSETPGGIRWSGPAEPGAHNQEIYGNLLHLDDAELARLHDEGTI